MRSLAPFPSNTIIATPLHHHIPLIHHPGARPSLFSSSPASSTSSLCRQRRLSARPRSTATLLQASKIDKEETTDTDYLEDTTSTSTPFFLSTMEIIDVEIPEEGIVSSSTPATATATEAQQLIERKPKNNNNYNNDNSQSNNDTHDGSEQHINDTNDLSLVDKDDTKANSWSSSILMGMPPTAILALNGVAIIWGTQHAVTKLVVDDSSAGPFTFLRFCIGALLASAPLLWQAATKNNSGPTQASPSETATTIPLLLDSSMVADDSETAEAPTMDGQTSSSVSVVETVSSSSTSTMDERQTNKTVLRWGSEMGFWMFLGFACQTIGLATTTAQRSGFLLYLNVKFVPFFAFVLLGRQISLPTWISALTAFAGTALLAYDGTSWSLNQGDLWSIAAAAASAMYILRLDVAAKAVGDNNSIQLNAACLWVVTILSGIWSLETMEDPSQFAHQLMDIFTHHPWEVIYLSAVTTALANFIQTKSQKEVTAERASVIYAMDPVYGAFFSNIILGETLTNLGFVGAGMITVAAATNALLDFGSNKSSSTAVEGAGSHVEDESESEANKTKSQ